LAQMRIAHEWRDIKERQTEIASAGSRPLWNVVGVAVLGQWSVAVFCSSSFPGGRRGLNPLFCSLSA